MNECGCLALNITLCQHDEYLFAPDNVSTNMAVTFTCANGNTFTASILTDGDGAFFIDSSNFPEGRFNQYDTWNMTAKVAGVDVVFTDPVSGKQATCIQLSFSREID